MIESHFQSGRRTGPPPGAPRPSPSFADSPFQTKNSKIKIQKSWGIAPARPLTTVDNRHIAQLCRQFRSKSKFKNLPVCHSSYKVCGPIYCEMKNRNRTSKRRHQDACIGRSGHSQIAIQNSKFKNLPLFLNTNPDPLRRNPGSPGVICFHD